jgi:uncharacterized membrane-anchored protein YhcB (DUF1043 family)
MKLTNTQAAAVTEHIEEQLLPLIKAKTAKAVQKVKQDPRYKKLDAACKKRQELFDECVSLYDELKADYKGLHIHIHSGSPRNPTISDWAIKENLNIHRKIVLSTVDASNLQELTANVISQVKKAVLL